jgi:hypothetical protein
MMISSSSGYRIVGPVVLVVIMVLVPIELVNERISIAFIMKNTIEFFLEDIDDSSSSLVNLSISTVVVINYDIITTTAATATSTATTTASATTTTSTASAVTAFKVFYLLLKSINLSTQLTVDSLQTLVTITTTTYC